MEKLLCNCPKTTDHAYNIKTDPNKKVKWNQLKHNVDFLFLFGDLLFKSFFQ